jgi:diaminohydroxyphosphoribosylaminopyrimidine deaminase/5-amino-6-(5-phosphoribosylamino)uracil reductase
VRDDEVMGRALELASAARRRTAPNPWVGCVVVRDGLIVGEGATQPPGQAHAEIEALRAAGDAAAGATAFVTLEPCSFSGRTGPCADALVAGGIARVVVAIEDPDPRVAGTGIGRLRAAGVHVDVGARAEAATTLLAPYLFQRRTGGPYVVAKLATSLDGKVAAADGTSQWITSEAARADAHELRADSQAVVVGSGTAIADHPALTVRDVDPLPARPPVRVVLDGRGRVPAAGPLFDPALAPTLIITTDRAPTAAVDAWSAAGAKVGVVGDAIALLGREGALQLLVEGGGALVGALLAERRVQRLVTYVAPVILGERGRPGYALPGPDTLANATRYRLVASAPIGTDLRCTYEEA